MKILHIVNNLDKGGAEKLLSEVLPMYTLLGHDITLLQLSDRHSSNKYLADLSTAGVKCDTLGKGSVYNPWCIFGLKKYLAKRTFDCIHVHLFPAMYFVVLAHVLYRANPAKIIFTEHSTINRRMENRLLRWIDRHIYKYYDRVVAISEAIATKLNFHYLLGDKIITIPNGININRIKQLPTLSKAQLTGELGIPPNSHLLLMTARFSYPKDQLSLVKALKFLPDRYHLLLAGEGELLSKLQTYIIDEGLASRVHFLGFRDDVIPLMKTVDINILSSAYEGLSGVTLEALVSGRPFLGTDVAGINDVVPDRRFLFPYGAIDELVTRIKQISEDVEYADLMIKDALDHVMRYDINRMLCDHITLYEELIYGKKEE